MKVSVSVIQSDLKILLIIFFKRTVISFMILLFTSDSDVKTAFFLKSVFTL